MSQQTENIVGNMLTWIVVKDLQRSIAFYTDVIGFEVQEVVPEYGWAELSGPTGATLGIAQESEINPIKAGSNAIIAIQVKDLMAARDHFIEMGAELVGEIDEVPGHVKMQTFKDGDGNVMQIVEKLG